MKPLLSRLTLIAAGSLIFMVACTLTSPSPDRNEPNAQNSNDEPVESFVEDSTQVDQWIETTSALPSVTLELVTTYSWREPKILSAQIDESGNIHLSLPLPIPDELAETPDAPRPGDFELFIVGGSAYTRIGSDDPVTVDDSYLTLLKDTLLGPEGPGLWLNILSEESFTPAGAETYGGFSTSKYIINGLVGEGSVSGTIWVDEQSAALVGAELTITENLFYPPESGFSGDVQISLQVERADVPAIRQP